MNFQFKLHFLLLLSSPAFNAQCPPANSIATITGLYTSDLNPSSGSILYIAPSATVTGNINLNNCSLYNCGVILSRKITMSQSVQNTQYILENNNILKCDTISLDTLGHLHNNDTLICGLFKLSNNTSVDNNYIMDVNYFLVEKGSKLNSQSSIKVNYFDMKDDNSSFYNLYSTISARKLFRIGFGTIMYGVVFICADSCFINDGTINNQVAPTWTPTIRVNNLSTNTGTINNIDFCDLTSSNGGMPDIDTGVLTNVTFCTSQQYYCDYSFTGVTEKEINLKKVLIFPNPASDYLNILSDDVNLENYEIEISNYLGQVVLKLPYSNSLSISTLSSGYYTLKIIAASVLFHTNFIKQ